MPRGAVERPLCVGPGTRTTLSFAREKIRAGLPLLQQAEDEVVQAFLLQSSLLRVPSGRVVAVEGDTCAALTFVLTGTARVYKLGESGRAITLYRVEPGESCVLTVSCLLGEQPFPAFAAAETDLEVVVVPAGAFREWVRTYPFWQRYVFGLIARRMADVMAVVEEVVFRRVDARLAGHLTGLGSTDQPIRKTHQQIATDLGTSREVVSRLLKEFERQGLVSLARNAVEVTDPDGLRAVAGETPEARRGALARPAGA
ncbi:MAG: Crp/Fnr family transcriptional regulator [Candidatus Latescibacterota bacterium]